MRWSIRTRLTLWWSALMVAALTALGIGVLWLHARWGLAQFDAELASLGAATSRVIQEELGESHNLARAVAETHTAMDVPGWATAILDVGGQPLAAHWHGFVYDRALWPAAGLPASSVTTVTVGGTVWRASLRRESSSDGDYAIFIAGPLAPLERQQDLLARVLLVAMPLLVLATAVVSWWVASSAIRPVTIMAARAEAMTAGSTEWRLDGPTGTDELGQLARAFNRLLDRLGAASQVQRQFMADASHELRTPVSVIQTAAEVTLDRPAREDWEYREALTIVTEQSARLSRMVEDMLVLARADAGGYRLTPHPLYVDEIVAECARGVSLVAATRQIRLLTALQPDVCIDADDGLLRQLVTNLLDNAVQYTSPGGSVEVAVTSDPGSATLTVSDTGPGIAPADRERVFERFIRLDAARSTTSGAGLGLPIARWIATLHGGTVTLEPAPSGGCLFTVRLPTTPQQPADGRLADRRSQTA